MSLFLWRSEAKPGLPMNNQTRSLETFQLNLKKTCDCKREDPVDFTLTPQLDAVSVLVYHRGNREFLLLKDFRPAVYVSRVSEMPENKRKDLRDIDWSKYDKAIGVRLCTGSIDYTQFHELQDIETTAEMTALKAIKTDFGLELKHEHLQHIDTFITGLDGFGSRSFLYYVEVDKKKPFWSEESPHKTSLSEEAVHDLLNSEAPLISTSDYYALLWWWFTKREPIPKTWLWCFTKKAATLLEAEEDTDAEERAKTTLEIIEKLYYFNGHQPRLDDVRLRQISQPTTTINSSYTMHFDTGKGTTKALDMLSPRRGDTLSILIRDIGDGERGRDEFVLTRRFRPTAFFARLGTFKDRSGKLNTNLKASVHPPDWWYTLELASGKAEQNESDDDAVLRIAAAQLGYRIPKSKLKFVRKLVIGSSHLGDSVHLYYAECGKEDRIEGQENREKEERVVKVNYPCYTARFMLGKQEFAQPLPPSVFIAFQLALNDNRL